MAGSILAGDDLRIVLLGKTGSGKSSAGNVILGEKKFKVSTDPNSVTQDCETERNSNTKIAVTDTPGIFDTGKSEKDLKYSIISCLTESAPGPHAFILVLKVGRYTKEEKDSVRKILMWFGEEALKHTVVLFTHGDELEENQTIDKYVKNDEDLKNLVDKCGGRVHVIDSKAWNKNPLEQINEIIIKKREAGESQVVQALEELKNNLLGPRSSTTDQEPGQGSGIPTSSGGNLDESQYRSNSFQIKQLLTAIDNMGRNNGGNHYTNESLRVIAKAIEEEVKKIKKEMEERGEKAEESEIRGRARKRVRNKALRTIAGVTTGALLGALLGAAVGLSLPGILAAGLLVGAATHVYRKCRAAGVTEAEAAGATIGAAGVIAVAAEAGVLGAAVAEAGAVGALGAAGAAAAEAGAVGALGAAGAAAAEAGAVGAVGSATAGAVAETGSVGALGAGAATGIGLGVAAGVLAAAGAIGGGVEGARAAAKSDNKEEAAKNAAKAVAERAGNMVKDVWGLGQRLTKGKEMPYEKL